jgi:hypothetical protein
MPELNGGAPKADSTLKAIREEFQKDKAKPPLVEA